MKKTKNPIGNFVEIFGKHPKKIYRIQEEDTGKILAEYPWYPGFNYKTKINQHKRR